MTAWIRREDDGVWSRPIETMDAPVELWPDELADFPPLVEAQAEVEELRVERDRLFAIVADLTSCGCWNPCMGDDDPDDLTLIRRAIDVGGDR